MDSSPKLDLPLILPQQAQKHATHNEALAALDALVHLSVESLGATLPPLTPDDGDCYIVADPGAGAWTGKTGQIAHWRDGGWRYHSPRTGFVAYIRDQAQLRVFSGSEWLSLSSIGDQNSFESLGIGTPADPGNPLSVRASGSLFNHAGNDHRVMVNRAGPADTASLIFQSGFAARAEIGLAGDQDMSIKTADTNGTWRTAMAIDPDSAEVSFPKTPSLSAPPLFNLFGDGGRCAGSPEPETISADGFVPPSYLQTFGGATITQGGKFIYNNQTHGGVEPALDPLVDDLMAKIHHGSTGSNRRYGPEFYTLQLTTQATGTVGASHAGQSYFLSLLTRTAIIPREVTLGYWLRATAQDILLVNSTTHRLFVDGVAQSGDRVISPQDGWVEVAIRISHSSSTYLGYDQLMTNLYTAPSSTCHLALMNLYPGHRPLSPGTRTGPLGSLNGWR